MTRPRKHHDGLPYRVYERLGLRVYSIGYKLPSGKWAFRYKCAITDAGEIARLRRQATIDSTKMGADVPIGGFAGLVSAWFTWQEGLPVTDGRKLADSTIKSCREEANNLVLAWGHFEPREITKKMGYDYLEACVESRPIKGNKEMTLARKILEWGIKQGVLENNPLTGLAKNTRKKTMPRLVTAEELKLAVETGRAMGGACHIVALGLRASWLCVRRSVEVRAITVDGIREDGMLWKDGKDPTKPAALISWTPELRATIDEALALRRFKEAGTMYLFGNMRGQRYTKGGWKKILHNLMTQCEKVAKEEGKAFAKFSLQDCRPMGVTDKIEKGHGDVQDATLHKDRKMIDKVYDRRQVKRSTPAA